MRNYFRRLSRPPGGLPCQEIVELVTEYLEGALSDDARRHFEQHISACDGCAAYLDQLRDVRRLLGSIRPDDVSPEAERRLGAAFRDWRDSRA